jgi:hypothetical protein
MEITPVVITKVILAGLWFPVFIGILLFFLELMLTGNVQKSLFEARKIVIIFWFIAALGILSTLIM